MSSALKASVLLNIGLAGGLLFLLVKGRSAAPSAPIAAPASSPAVETSFNPAAQEPNAFHWNQLESADYRIYIANLRGIGCPEQTIRDIITADVDSLYAPRREKWQRQRNQAGGAAQNAAMEQLQNLRKEESELLLVLLGAPGSDPSAAARAGRTRADEVAIALPLAFQEVDTAGLNLDAGRQQAIIDLKQSFIEQIGGLNQDPNDAGYRERWQKAQPESDEMLKAAIGIHAFQELQVQAATAGSPDFGSR